MTWSYWNYADDDVDTVITNVQNHLDDITSNSPNAAIMVAISDQHDGDARGLVFSNPSLSSQSHVKSAKWQHQTESSSTDYDSLYSGIADLLNGGTLTLQSQYWAQLAYTNHKSGDATLTLFYPTSN